MSPIDTGCKLYATERQWRVPACFSHTNVSRARPSPERTDDRPHREALARNWPLVLLLVGGMLGATWVGQISGSAITSDAVANGPVGGSRSAFVAAGVCFGLLALTKAAHLYVFVGFLVALPIVS